MRELCGVGLGRAYSHEMWFAMRLAVGAEMIALVDTSEALPAKSSEVF
jgi:hypothetical protein